MKTGTFNCPECGGNDWKATMMYYNARVMLNEGIPVIPSYITSAITLIRCTYCQKEVAYPSSSST